MNFADVARTLAHGELSQLAVAKGLLGSPTQAQLSQLADAVNLGLTAIYKRFTLKKGMAKLPLFPLVELYPIRDGSVLKIQSVLNERDEALPLNDASNVLSCTTPSTKTLQVPKALAEQAGNLPEKFKTSCLKVNFQAGHPIISAEDLVSQGMTGIELELPITYLQALLFFVASRYHNPVGMVNEFNAGNNYAVKFEAECKRLELENMEVTEDITLNRLERGGWV